MGGFAVWSGWTIGTVIHLQRRNRDLWSRLKEAKKNFHDAELSNIGLRALLAAAERHPDWIEHQTRAIVNQYGSSAVKKIKPS